MYCPLPEKESSYNRRRNNFEQEYSQPNGMHPAQQSQSTNQGSSGVLLQYPSTLEDYYQAKNSFNQQRLPI